MGLEHATGTWTMRLECRCPYCHEEIDLCGYVGGGVEEETVQCTECHRMFELMIDN